ncbi:MAG: RNA-binding transcriptional accessory protein, partial [Bacteroidetes bacterium SW_10_40_5]
MAIFRSEREGRLRLKIGPDAEEALRILNKKALKGNNEATEQIGLALEDAYKRLLQPSLETEARNEANKQADEEAIDVFGENLRQLMWAPPLGQKNVLAIDPGYRTICKLVCLNAQGDFLTNDTIYPFYSGDKKQEALNKFYSLLHQYQIQAIAIGNGREAERWVKSMKWAGYLSIFSVYESGASVYSASEAAREEFPSLDLTVRGAISIGRRLMAPLAELVKIDPKSIGVGQYHYEVNQKRLKERLDQVVMHCVNRVGVHVNMAGKHLLTYGSGLGPQLAQNIVVYKSQNGAFNSRSALKKVPKLGAKAFEQAAGFLRIPESKHPLDNSGVHPESYGVVEQMAKDLNCNIHDLLE